MINVTNRYIIRLETLRYLELFLVWKASWAVCTIGANKADDIYRIMDDHRLQATKLNENRLPIDQSSAILIEIMLHQQQLLLSMEHCIKLCLVT